MRSRQVIFEPVQVSVTPLRIRADGTTREEQEVSGVDGL
jgi:hypothetical protein